MSESALALKEKPKGELIQTISRMRDAARRYRVKERAKHGANIMIGSTLAAVGGGIAGVLQAKMPTVPKLPSVRSDLAAGTLLSLAAAANLFDGVDEQVNDVAKGLIGAGVAGTVAPMLHK